MKRNFYLLNGKKSRRRSRRNKRNRSRNKRKSRRNKRNRKKNKFIKVGGTSTFNPRDMVFDQDPNLQNLVDFVKWLASDTKNEEEKLMLDQAITDLGVPFNIEDIHKTINEYINPNNTSNKSRTDIIGNLFLINV